VPPEAGLTKRWSRPRARQKLECDSGSGHVFSFTPAGARTTFASGFVQNSGVITDAAGNTYVTQNAAGNITKISTTGVRTIFAAGLFNPQYLALEPTLSTAAAVVADFNGDGHPDWVVRNPGTRQTAIWYLNNNIFMSGALDPTLPAGWGLRGAANFNSDSHPDYGLFNLATRQTAIWYLLGPTFIGSAFGPTPPTGWALVATTDFNGDGKPDFVLYNAATRQTAIWYLNNNVFVNGAAGPTLPPGWSLIAP
jgi:FG-GAP repeat